LIWSSYGRIVPHVGYYGYSEMVLRCHLGLLVPEQVPNGFDALFCLGIVLVTSGRAQTELGGRKMLDF
jgi:hypothetical protein